ncbi:MAG: response regulator [Prevotellaceae bacterium]|jgi:signal transduction histidine kinase/CheY-like chemotaxis protein|nr:response regulator [Prevotellaceae bacterium]
MVTVNTFYHAGDIDVQTEDIKKIMSVLSAHGIALWEYDIFTGECFLDEAYFQILGLDKIGIHFSSLEGSYAYIHPDDLLHYKRFFESVIRKEIHSNTLTYRYMGTKGEIVWAEDHFVAHEKDGVLDGLIVYTTNINEKVAKDQEFVQLAEKGRRIIEAIPEFIFIFDENFFFVDVMKSSAIELLHTPDKLIGTDARDLYSPEVSELFIETIHECLQEQKLCEIEYPLTVFDQHFYYQARIAPFEDGKVLALIHDISQRVRRSKDLIEAKRKAEEADRMKNVFIANMSHEIRTPLNAIVGFSEIVSMNEDPEERDEYLAIIRKNCGLLLQLIDDILDLSRIEAGKEEMHFERISLTRLIKDMEMETSLKIPAPLQFYIVLPEEDIYVYADRNRLTQVLNNFLSNAIKNTTEGSITLGAERENDHARIYVTDTGCGIPKEKLSTIFNRFEKLDEFKQGTGLGLPICKHIMDRLGGEIKVTSTLGIGSTFAAHLHLLNSEMRNQRTLKKRKVLFADKSENSYRQIKETMKDSYNMIWVTDGQEAIDRFIDLRPDMVVINMHLPTVNGATVIEKVRTISPTIPIIAIIEHAYYTEQRQAFQSGCNETISTPYSIARLKELIDSFLNNL